jgi:hypothetical protein
MARWGRNGIAGRAQTCSRKNKAPVITTPVSTPRGRPPKASSSTRSGDHVPGDDAHDRTDQHIPQYVADRLRKPELRDHRG